MGSLTAGFWVVAAVGVLAELGPRAGEDGRPGRSRVHLSICTSLGILLVWGTWPALAAQAVASLVAAARLRLTPTAAGLLLARMTVAIAVAAGIVSVSGLGNVRRTEGIDRSILTNLSLVVLGWLVAYYGPAVVIDRWLRHGTWRTVFHRGLAIEILASTSLLFLAPVLVAEPRGWTLVLLAIPVLALNQMTGRIGRQAAALRRDRLTGLLNRQGLAETAQEYGRVRRTGTGRYAVLVVRLWNLRSVDDSFGRPVVDRVLASAAGRLAAAFDGNAVVGRPDSDDLVVLVPRTDEPDAGGSGQVGSAATVINQALEEPVLVDGLPYETMGSVGIAQCPEDAEDLPSLLRNAGAAVRHAWAGRSRVAAFTPTPQEELDKRLSLLTDLVAALRGRAEGGRIDFVYQPQVRLDSGAVVAVEALLRWTHPKRGAVRPDELLRVAEPTPLMHDLTRLAIDTITRQLRQWNDRGIGVCAAVNVSVRDLREDWLVEELLDRVAWAAIEPDQLVIEVTESEAIDDPDRVRAVVERLTAARIRMAIDDFGTGYASLQHLRQLAFDQLKIDKSLVVEVAEGPDEQAVVRAVIELARSLGLTVIAEGVENRTVHDTLRELGCPMGQGWFYGRPTTAAGITRTLETRTRDGARPTHEPPWREGAVRQQAHRTRGGRSLGDRPGFTNE